MHEVFVNYRTGDGEDAATLVEHYLSDRFGTERIFRASKSIKPGENFQAALASGVKDSVALLAIIGPQWPRDPRLHDPADWVRKELLAAYACGGHVIPVLKGRTTPRLNADDLPAQLAWLADLQSLILDTQDSRTSLKRIGDVLAERMPSLRATDQEPAQLPSPGDTRNSASDIRGPVVQGRDIGGNVGTTISDNQGPVHTGTGSIYTGGHFDNSPQVSGGGTYIVGDNHGGVTHRSGGSSGEPDEGAKE